MRVDALVVGGGIQGLLILRALSAAGYGCMLVTRDALGAGQTLHSHGLLDSGTGLVTGETRRELHEHVLPELQQLGVPVASAAPSYLALPPAILEQVAPAWAVHDHRPDLLSDDEDIPGLRLPRPVHRVVTHHVHKSALVHALTSELLDRVVSGQLLAVDPTCTIALADDGGVLEVDARAVIIAAGCGTSRLLRETLKVADPLLDRLGHVRTHMLCLRAPAGVLPRVGTVVTPGLAVVAHEDDTGASTWYVTPAVGQPERVKQVPDDAHAEVDPGLVKAGVEQLQQLVPVLSEGNPAVEATVFAGYKQDVDGQVTRRLVGVVTTAPLLLIAVPSIFAGAWQNAREVVHHVRSLGPQEVPHLRIPAGLAAVEVGQENELTAAVNWMTWRDLTKSTT